MSRQSAKTVFIFDWDGTLLNVSEQILSSLQISINSVITDANLHSEFPILKELPLVTPFTLRPFIGLRFKEKILPDLFPEVCDDKKLVDVFYSAFLSLYREKKSSLFPGALDLLQKIKSDDSFGIALATNKSRDLLVHELSDHELDDLFDYIVCGDDPHHGGRTKPKPDMIECLYEHFPEATGWYMVGDSPADVLASKHASRHVVSVGVFNNQHASSCKILEQTEPDLLIEHVSDLPKYTFAKESSSFFDA